MPPDEKAPSQPTPAAAASSSLSLVSEAGTEFEALDQLGPMVQSILKSGKQDLFLDQLGLFIKRKEAEIERLCSSHFEVRWFYLSGFSGCLVGFFGCRGQFGQGEARNAGIEGSSDRVE